MTQSRRSDGGELLGDDTESTDIDFYILGWQRERPDLDMSPLRIFFPLREAFQNTERRRTDLLAPYGLTPTSLGTLVTLLLSGEPFVRTPSELARMLALTAAGVSQQLERLERVGMIRRSVSKDDRRVVRVKLTNRGRKALDKIMTEYAAQQEQFLHALTSAERAQLSALLFSLCRSVASSDDNRLGIADLAEGD
jgi:DNA-binding MarR family transcriptional regulator